MVYCMNLNSTRFFVKIVKAGGISEASKVTNLPKATFSRHLSKLEEQLGERLINRSTRALSLTALGQEYFSSVEEHIEKLEFATLQLLQEHAVPAGLIRVGISAGYCQFLVLPLVKDFIQRYPKVKVELTLSEQKTSIIKDGLDFAIETGVLADSELLCRKLTQFRQVLCASPDYLKHNAIPETPTDLLKHECIILAQSAEKWCFSDEPPVVVPWKVAAGSICNIEQLVLNGLGIGLLPEFLAAKHLDSGAMHEVLANFRMADINVNMLYANNKAKSAAAMALIEYLIQKIRLD